MEDIEKIYQRFRSFALGQAEGEVFDEDDIVDAVDCARDHDDTFVITEAFIYGHEHFPDSELLNARRISYYYTYGNLQGDEVWSLSQRLDCAQEPVVQFIQAVLSAETPRDTLRLLKEALQRCDRLEDEDAIRLVDILKDADLLDQALTLIGSVTPHLEYPATFIYELALKLTENNDWAKVDELCDRLTKMEPFNKDYWALQAEVCYHINDAENASVAMGYIDAIDPHDPYSAWIKAWLLSEKETDGTSQHLANLAEAKKILRRCLKATPYHEDARALYARLAIAYPEPEVDDKLIKLLIDNLLIYNDLAVELLMYATSRGTTESLLKAWIKNVPATDMAYNIVLSTLVNMQLPEQARVLTRIWNKMRHTNYPLPN